MIRYFLAICLSLITGCSEPPSADTKVIIGATLIGGAGSPIPNSVIVVKDDVVSAVGTQQMTPIPPGSSKIEAYGKYVRHTEPNAPIQVGSKANLVLLSGDPGSGPVDSLVERRMTDGRWTE